MLTESIQKQIIVDFFNNSTAVVNKQKSQLTNNKRTHAFYQQNFLSNDDENEYYENRFASKTFENFNFDFQYKVAAESEHNKKFFVVDELEVNFTTFIIITHTCRRCDKKFQFSNKLHKHFKKCIVKKISVLYIAKTENFIIDFKTSSNVNIKYNFCF